MEGTDLQVVQFFIGGEEYAISISQVQEILIECRRLPIYRELKAMYAGFD